MTKADKLRTKILSGVKKNIRFSDLCTFLKQTGFTPEQNATSHQVFRKEGYPKIVIQPKSDGSAKPYQIGQIREIFEKYDL